MNKIIDKISSAALKRLVLIENNNLELLKQFKTNEENTKIFRLETTENYIVSNEYKNISNYIHIDILLIHYSYIEPLAYRWCPMKGL